MTTILAIDPGTTESGWVLLGADGVPLSFGKWENLDLLHAVGDDGQGRLAIEMVASYGMAVGAEVFETCVWAGRFIQRWHDARSWTIPDHRPVRVYRRDVKLHLCGQTRAKDGNVRQALIDRFGGKEKAIGRKANPGPCYGMSGDVWQALGLAVTVHDGAVTA